MSNLQIVKLNRMAQEHPNSYANYQLHKLSKPRTTFKSKYSLLTLIILLKMLFFINIIQCQ